MDAYLVVHVLLRSGHLHKYRNCYIHSDGTSITITQGREISLFPLSAIDVISALRKDGDEGAMAGSSEHLN